jgi:hypothetical protein
VKIGRVKGKVQCVQKFSVHWAAVYRYRPRTLNELKTAITAYIRNISEADLQKVSASKIERAQACIDGRRHHFQHLYKCTATFRTHCTSFHAVNVIVPIVCCISSPDVGVIR